MFCRVFTAEEGGRVVHRVRAEMPHPRPRV